MPTYDFECLGCGKQFTTSTTIAQHLKEKPKCPKCGHRKTTTVFKPTFVYTPDRG